MRGLHKSDVGCICTCARAHLLRTMVPPRPLVHRRSRRHTGVCTYITHVSQYTQHSRNLKYATCIIWLSPLNNHKDVSAHQSPYTRGKLRKRYQFIESLTNFITGKVHGHKHDRKVCKPSAEIIRKSISLHLSRVQDTTIPVLQLLWSNKPLLEK